jgi:hypothetical protein
MAGDWSESHRRTAKYWVGGDGDDDEDDEEADLDLDLEDWSTPFLRGVEGDDEEFGMIL